MISAECHHGDHLWRGGGVCSCGARLRCYCGRFVTERGIEAHLANCPASTSGASHRTRKPKGGGS